MAGWGEGPLRNEGQGPEVTEANYGPQTDVILRMIEQCDRLSDEQLELMASAFNERGMVTDVTAWDAAREESDERMKQTASARWDLKLSMESNGFGRDPDVFRICSWAANDAALAVSTRDLIGQHGYFMWDYDKLMYPWRVGVGDPE